MHQPSDSGSLLPEQPRDQEHEAPAASGYLSAERHFSTNINLGWQKLDEYYTKLDFCAAVVLHPRQKWRWFEKHWAGRQEWIDEARVSVEQLRRSYKCDELLDNRPDPPKKALEQVVARLDSDHL